MSLDRLSKSGLIEENVALGPLTTYKAGGPSRFFSAPNSVDELEELAGLIRGHELDVLVLGRGSNLLVSDDGFDGITIQMAQGFDGIEYEGLRVTAGAGATLPRVARGSVDAGIAGLEFFVGVPGSVGGAVRQNAGCFGVETRDRMVEATLIDLGKGERFTAGPDDLDMSYRHSNVQSDWIVVSAVFEGTGADVSNSREELKRITRWRKDHQPGGTLNAGSVFKNPEGTSAGALIDAAGLKGLKMGEVSVSEKHANFFVASKSAKSSDVRKLVFHVRDLVEARMGVRLEPEIQMVGFDDDD